MRKNRNNSAEFKRLRLIVLKRDNYTCYMCGGFADQADHLWPRSKGGGDTLENLAAACRKCNRSKSDKVNVQTTYVNPKYRKTNQTKENDQ